MSSRRRRGCLPRTPSGGCRCRSEPPGRRRRLCGRRQQLIVAGTERARIHLVLLVQAETEEQPRTCTGSCRRRNPSSSSATSPPTCTGAVSLPRSRRRRLLLRVDHQLAELVRRQLARGALLEHRPLEQEPAGDVDRHRRRAESAPSMIVSCSAGVTVFSAALRRIVSQKVLAVSASGPSACPSPGAACGPPRRGCGRRGELVSERGDPSNDGVKLARIRDSPGRTPMQNARPTLAGAAVRRRSSAGRTPARTGRACGQRRCRTAR